jgi:hypothetical protein
MEDKIYQILKKHRLPLKKREEILADLLLLLDVVGRSEQLFCGKCENGLIWSEDRLKAKSCDYCKRVKGF